MPRHTDPVPAGIPAHDGNARRRIEDRNIDAGFHHVERGLIFRIEKTRVLHGKMDGFTTSRQRHRPKINCAVLR